MKINPVQKLEVSIKIMFEIGCLVDHIVNRLSTLLHKLKIDNLLNKLPTSQLTSLFLCRDCLPYSFLLCYHRKRRHERVMTRESEYDNTEPATERRTV